MLKRQNNRCLFTEPQDCFTTGRPASVEMRPHRNVLIEDEKSDMSGKGIEDTTMLIMRGVKFVLDNKEVAKDFLAAADEVVFGDLGTNISNTLSHALNKNPEWRPGYSGERHTVLPTAHGLTRANFAGPGTRISERIARGDVGVDGPDGIDAASKVHDIEYMNASTISEIHTADRKFIKNVRKSTAPSGMKKLVIGAMKAKKFGETIGVLPQSTFSGIADDPFKHMIREKAVEFAKSKFEEDLISGEGLLPADKLMKILSNKKR